MITAPTNPGLGVTPNSKVSNDTPPSANQTGVKSADTGTANSALVDAAANGVNKQQQPTGLVYEYLNRILSSKFPQQEAMNIFDKRAETDEFSFTKENLNDFLNSLEETVTGRNPQTDCKKQFEALVTPKADEMKKKMPQSIKEWREFLFPSLSEKGIEELINKAKNPTPKDILTVERLRELLKSIFPSFNEENIEKLMSELKKAIPPRKLTFENENQKMLVKEFLLLGLSKEQQTKIEELFNSSELEIDQTILDTIAKEHKLETKALLEKMKNYVKKHNDSQIKIIETMLADLNKKNKMELENNESLTRTQRTEIQELRNKIHNLSLEEPELLAIMKKAAPDLTDEMAKKLFNLAKKVHSSTVVVTQSRYSDSSIRDIAFTSVDAKKTYIQEMEQEIGTKFEDSHPDSNNISFEDLEKYIAHQRPGEDVSTKKARAECVKVLKAIIPYNDKPVVFSPAYLLFKLLQLCHEMRMEDLTKNTQRQQNYFKLMKESIEKVQQLYEEKADRLEIAAWFNVGIGVASAVGYSGALAKGGQNVQTWSGFTSTISQSATSINDNTKNASLMRTDGEIEKLKAFRSILDSAYSALDRSEKTLIENLQTVIGQLAQAITALLEAERISR